MQSPDFLLPIITDLALDKAWAKKISTADSDELPDVDALTHMSKILKLAVKPGTNIINITVSSDVPQEAADIANAIADRYKTLRDVEEDQRNNRGADALHDQIAQQQQVVDEAKATLEKLPQDQAAKRDLEQQQTILDALNVRLKQVIIDAQLVESPVRIISRAEPPTAPSKPNKSFDFMVTIVAATFLSIFAASFTEVILMLARASERTDN
jgi:uncharacterized protein involved in exopolysaccharide biosynthesis